jgi:hypothetical protein
MMCKRIFKALSENYDMEAKASQMALTHACNFTFTSRGDIGNLMIALKFQH